MSRNESDGNGLASGPDHEESSGSDFAIVDAPYSESIVSAITENETTDGMSDTHVSENEITDGISDVHISKTAGARRKDEYDVDFE
jgi:hypothetical protein